MGTVTELSLIVMSQGIHLRGKYTCVSRKFCDRGARGRATGALAAASAAALAAGSRADPPNTPRSCVRAPPRPPSH